MKSHKVSAILKNKKVLFQKKKFLSRCHYQNKKVLFTDPIFSEGFGYALNEMPPFQKAVAESTFFVFTA